MHRRYLVSASLTLAVLATTGAPAPAQADPAFDESYEVVSVKADKTVVKPQGLTPAPVTFTLQTRRAANTEWPHPASDFMTLTQDVTYHSQQWEFAHLKRVSTVNGVTTWRGTMQVSGPSRTLLFSALDNCLMRDTWSLRCGGFEPLPLNPIKIKVESTATPVVTIDLKTPAQLSSPTYVVKGRVLKSTGRSYGKPLVVNIARGNDCRFVGTGTRVRVKADGTFAFPPYRMRECRRRSTTSIV